jgi:hypothetical protein
MAGWQAYFGRTKLGLVSMSIPDQQDELFALLEGISHVREVLEPH